FDLRIAPRWVSLNYGTREPAFAIIYSLCASPPFTTRMALIPFQAGQEEKIEQVLAFAETIASKDSA
ncbi:MAG TPA: hypothetical protein VJX67_02795, partial [Blastocatellia bacterium]|nr:hypothetical protein [Blastocatellia bacterium]